MELLLPSVAMDFESSAAFLKAGLLSMICMVKAAERFELYKRLSISTIV